MFRYPHRSEYYLSYSTQSYGRIITVITPLLTLICVMCIISSQLLYLSAAQAENTGQFMAVPGTLSPLIKHSRVIAHADARQTIQLSFGLRLRSSAPFDQALAQAIYSVRHRPHLMLNTDEVINRFSPTQASYTALIQWLQAAGFHITHTYTHRLLVDFEGTIEQVQRGFHLRINRYKAPDGTLYYANSGAPLLPPNIASQLISINGLNDATRWSHPALQQGSLMHRGSHTCGVNGTQAATTGLTDLYQAHYTGSGQTMALFELDEPAINDLHIYMACTKHKATTLERIGTPIAASPAGDAATIDAEAILSSVPQLQGLTIYAAANNEKSYLDQWGQIIQDNPAVVSSSWGICEPLAPAQLVRQEELFFQLATLQGQSIIAASTTGCAASSIGVSVPQASVNDPASQPLVTGVGTTTLIFDTPHGTHDTLQAAGRPDPAVLQPSLTGGISQLWAMPDWQRIQTTFPARASAQSASTCPHTVREHSCREVPDVAFNADSHHSFWAYCGQSCASRDPWFSVKGSALAAPYWGAFVTLSNQLAQQHGVKRLGFLNPLLYQLADNPVSYTSSFRDIIASSEHSVHAAAGVGYDLSSGLGEYRAQHLAQQLAQLLQSSAG